MAVGLNLIIGFSGQFSLGHAGFMAIGAYAAALISMNTPTYGGFSWDGSRCSYSRNRRCRRWVSNPAFKWRLFSYCPLGVAEIIRILLINFKEITNGPSGLFGIEPFVDWQMVYGFMAITTLFIVNYIRSGAGRATMAIREDEIAAEAMGVNTTKYKSNGLYFGAMTASIAGSLHAGYLQSIAPKDFAFTKSVDILILVVLGGIGSVTGTFYCGNSFRIINMYLQDFWNIADDHLRVGIDYLDDLKPGGLLGTKELSVKKILTKFKKGDDQNASVGN